MDGVVGAAPVPVDVLVNPVETFAAYCRWLERTGLSANTKRAYAGEASGYVTWLGEQDKHRVEDVFLDPHARDYAVRDYKRWMLTVKQRRPKGVDLALTAVGSLYAWVGLGPAKVALTAGKQETAPQALTVDQVRDVLRSAERRGPRDLGLTALIVGTGLRVSEVAALNTDDVWVSDRRGAVQVRAGKGDRPREVPLNTQTQRAVRGWLAVRASWPGAGGSALFLSREGRRLAVRSIRYAVAEVGRGAGVDLRPHMLRHTFGTLLVRGGTDLVVTADLMGHRSVETTRGYARPTKDEARQAVAGLAVDY